LNNSNNNHFVCNHCGNPVTQHYDWGTILIAVALFPIGLIALGLPKTTRCLNCGTDTKPIVKTKSHKVIIIAIVVGLILAVVIPSCGILLALYNRMVEMANGNLP
jgi:hypothetical protein